MTRIRIKARIRLLPSTESGRTSPITRSYRPNHNFGDPDNREMVTGFLDDFPEGEMLWPGESKEMEITMWSFPGLAAILVIGKQWRIQEGDKLVGTGEIIDVLD